MMKIIGLFPLTGNGGIASWTKRFMATFPNDEYQFSFIDIAPSKPRSGGKEPLLKRISTGLFTLIRIKSHLGRAFRTEQYEILHITTSGNIGSLRDIEVARMCKRHGVKTVMHCRYGCIPEDYNSGGFIGRLLHRSIGIYDQIWVLDRRSYNFLTNIESLRGKVFLTPNSIEVKDNIDLIPKEYKRIAFVGNLIPSKGLYELVEASIECDVRLDIIGPGKDEVNNRIIELAGEHLNRQIYLHGKVSNQEAVTFMHEVDIIALPTYYPSEAFPISIIEAMSLTKMVIACPRAAIPDMLTGLDGKPCGLLVPEKSVRAIIDAIKWCQLHKEQADQMCRNAYEKVYNCYRTDIVYELYRHNYEMLV